MRPRPDFVGRRDEFRDTLQALIEGCRLVLVVGDAGIGKSRFSAEVLRELTGTGWRAVVCGALPMAEKLPLLPWGDAFRQLLHLDDESLLEAAMQRCAPYARREIARLVPQLGSEDSPPRPGENWQRERLFTAVGDVLDEIASEPPGLLLLVEDLHWADESTLDLATYLIAQARSPNLRIIVTCRSDEPQLARPVVEWLARARRMPDTHEVRLGPLSRDDAAALVANLVAPDAVDAVATDVYRRAEGHPFYTEQLVGAWLAESSVPQQGLPRPLPAGLADVLTARVERCSEQARRVLAALSVARRPLTDPLLAEIAGVDEAMLGDALHELSADGLLAPQTTDGLARPRHALLAEAVLDNLLPGERRLLHARTAEALRSTAEQSLAAEVAVHWSEAGRTLEELCATVDAAEAATRVFAFSEAADLWQHAIALSDEHPHLSVEAELDLAVLHVQAIDALEAAGSAERKAHLAERAFARFADVPDRKVAAAVHVRVAQIRGVESAAAARPLLEEALRLFAGTPPSAEHAQALFHHANLHRHEGDANAGTAGLERALAVAEQAGADAVAAWVLGPLSLTHFLRGDLDGGFAALRRGRALIDRLEATSTDVERAVASIASFESDSMLKLCRWDEAHQTALWGLDHLRRGGRAGMFGATILTANAVEALLNLGRTADAAALIDPVTDSEPDRDNWVLHGSRALVDLWRGQLAGAVRRTRAVDEVVRGDYIQFDSEYTRDTAEIALWDRRPQEALERVEGVLQVVEDTDEQQFCGALLTLGSRACADLAGSARARRDQPSLTRAMAALERLAAILDRMQGAPFVDHPFAARIPADRAAWQAELSRARGDSRPELWAATATACQAITMSVRVGYARWRQAEAVLEHGGTAAEATPLLRAASESAVGAVPLAEAIDALAQRARIRLDPAPVVTQAKPPMRESGYGLTDRELLVLQLITTGRTNKQIGAELFMSPKTASVHVTNILRKLGATNRVEAAMLAERAGLGRRV